MVKFSEKYDSVDLWLAGHLEDTPYRRRILRMHRKYPQATLAQLRGHPGKGEEPLYWITPREASPEVLARFMRLAERYAELAECFTFDEKGHKITWRRPDNEPV